MSKDKDKSKSHDENKFDFNTHWYELWMKQSKDFFDSADKNLKNMFAPGVNANPEEHMKQINQWLEALKSQWQFMPSNEQQKMFENNWKIMTKMCNDAAELMVQQWIKRNHEHKPVKDVHDLYQLWLNSCNDVYNKAMHSKSFQEAYGDFMNAAIQFWKATSQK